MDCSAIFSLDTPAAPTVGVVGETGGDLSAPSCFPSSSRLWLDDWALEMDETGPLGLFCSLFGFLPSTPPVGDCLKTSKNLPGDVAGV